MLYQQIRDGEKALRQLFPGCVCAVDEYRGHLFVTVLDENSEEIPVREIIPLLRPIANAAYAKRHLDDGTWRSLETLIREMENEPDLKEWRAMWRAQENRIKSDGKNTQR